jgi:hypothetical protein
VNPSGRLPVSMPRSTGSQPYTYLHPILGGPSGVTSTDSTPLRPFGFGLTYTAFAYSDLAVDAAAGIPAYGFTMVPAAHADALRRVVLSPVRSSVRSLIRRPPPFDTYHTSSDALETLEPAALHRAAAALTAVVAELD